MGSNNKVCILSNETSAGENGAFYPLEINRLGCSEVDYPGNKVKYDKRYVQVSSLTSSTEYYVQSISQVY